MTDPALLPPTPRTACCRPLRSGAPAREGTSSLDALRPFLGCLRLAGAVLFTSAAVHADFTAEAFVSHRGAPAGEVAGWDTFSSAVGGANAPDHPATTPGAGFDLVQLDPGAFLTGGNIYSFSGPTRFVVSHAPAPAQAAADLTRVSLQVSTLGNELDHASVLLEYVDGQGLTRTLPWDARTELVRSTLGGFGDAVETQFEWDLAALPDTIGDYRLRFATAAAHASLDAVLVDALWSAAPFTYCAPSAGSCAPAIGWSGAPALSSSGSSAPFTLDASGLPLGQPALLFYGTTGAKMTPFGGGWRCLRPPFRRTPVQVASGGSACGGTGQLDFGVHLSSGADRSLAAYATVQAQFWFLDPGAPTGAGFTDAIQFVPLP